MSKTNVSAKYLQFIRNIGIIAHIDAGKTTLTERMLYYSKKIHRMGEVHEGTATMDYMPEEQERGITITSACTSCKWQDKEINIIDTPGHVDFTIEVERSLRVLDGAVGVFCAVGGVEPQSETVWRQSEQYQVPKIVFVNKLDRLGANFEAVVQAMKDKLNTRPLVLQIPEGEGEDFTGVIDLLTEEYLCFDLNSHGEQFERKPLSAEQKSRVYSWKENLIEALAEEDETLLDRYVSGEDIQIADLNRAIRRATLGLRGVPVLTGSALKNIGVQPVLDSICAYLPSPMDVTRVTGIDPQTYQEKSFPVSPQASLSALVFKVTVEGGRMLSLMRIYSGTIKAGESVYNSTKDEMQRLARLFTLHAGSKARLDEAKAGQIVAAAGMKNAQTGDTLCRNNDAIILERICEYKPVMSLALEPRNSSEEEKLIEVLEKILQEDPTLFLHRDKDTEQIILSGMGELHLEVVLDRLCREYNLELRSGKPQVVYQETIRNKAEAQEEFYKELGEVWHYGHVRLALEPLERNKENQIVFTLDVSEWPKTWTEAVCQGVEDGLQGGLLKGYPVYGVRVLIQEMQYSNAHSSEVGYHLAAAGALKKAMAEAGPLLMEPIMWVEVFVPNEFVGDVISLLGSKNAKIENMFFRGEQKVVQALTPLHELFGFSTSLRSATQGRGNFIMKFDRFDVLE